MSRNYVMLKQSARQCCVEYCHFLSHDKFKFTESVATNGNTHDYHSSKILFFNLQALNIYT